MEKIEQIEVKGKRLFLRETKDSYRIVYPIKIDGKISWKNLIAGGSWWNLLKIAVIVLMILGCIWEYSQVKTIADACMQNPLCRF